MADDDPAPSDPDADPTSDGDRSQPSESPLTPALRALKLFLLPFLFSWAFAYVGSARGVEWLYYAGLGGVTLSLIVLMIWLIS